MKVNFQNTVKIPPHEGQLVLLLPSGHQVTLEFAEGQMGVRLPGSRLVHDQTSRKASTTDHLVVNLPTVAQKQEAA